MLETITIYKYDPILVPHHNLLHAHFLVACTYSGVYREARSQHCDEIASSDRKRDGPLSQAARYVEAEDFAINQGDLAQMEDVPVVDALDCGTIYFLVSSQLSSYGSDLLWFAADDR